MEERHVGLHLVINFLLISFSFYHFVDFLFTQLMLLLLMRLFCSIIILLVIMFRAMLWSAIVLLLVIFLFCDDLEWWNFGNWSLCGIALELLAYWSYFSLILINSADFSCLLLSFVIDIYWHNLNISYPLVKYQVENYLS